MQKIPWFPRNVQLFPPLKLLGMTHSLSSWGVPVLLLVGLQTGKAQSWATFGAFSAFWGLPAPQQKTSFLLSPLVVPDTALQAVNMGSITEQPGPLSSASCFPFFSSLALSSPSPLLFLLLCCLSLHPSADHLMEPPLLHSDPPWGWHHHDVISRCLIPWLIQEGPCLDGLLTMDG